ncbi:MAG: ribbon-helix-helix domain-containing protein [Polyangiales bacterium]
MKNVSISLTTQHACAIESELATGDYASVSEVVRAALRAFFDRAPVPSEAQMLADFAEMQRGLAQGETLVDVQTARACLHDTLRG